MSLADEAAFLRGLCPLKAAHPDARIPFKFGDVHVQKGFSSLHQRDLGDMVAKFADAEGTQSMHLFVYSAKGTPAGYGRFGKPIQYAPFTMHAEESDKWLTPAIQALLPQRQRFSGQTHTVFDFRKLRGCGIDLSEQWQHVIYAYDIFILMPEVTPAHLIE